MHTSDFYKVGQIVTVRYTFKTDILEIQEYIHCIIQQHTDVDPYGNITEMRVGQIHNLEKFYLTGEFENLTERIIKMRNSELVINCVRF